MSVQAVKFPTLRATINRMTETNTATKMKAMKILMMAICGAALLASPALAEQKESRKQTCCEKAAAEGTECKRKCCLAAHRDGKSCEKCNPNKEDLKAAKKGGRSDRK